MSTDCTVHRGFGRLMTDFSTRFHAVVSGIGWGKTHHGPPWCEIRRNGPNQDCKLSLILAPTHALLKNRCFEEYRDFLSVCGLIEGSRGDYSYNRSAPSLTFHDTGQVVLGVTGAKPENLVAYNAGHIWSDEPATQPHETFRRANQRLRDPLARALQMLLTGTGEGFNWYYEEFGPQKCPIEEMDGLYSSGTRRLVLHGSTYDNPYLLQSFTDTLKEEFGFDAAYYDNYILGKWVNLAKNQFYFSFLESKHVGDYPLDRNNKRLVLTWDANVGKMTWVAMQKGFKDGKEAWFARVENGSNGRNYQDACQQFILKFPPAEFKDWHIAVYGDAVLTHRSEHSYQTGVDIIKEMLRPHYPRLSTHVPIANPFVEERSRRTNSLLANGGLYFDRSCRKVIESAKAAETDGKGGIKKPKDDDHTHAMEAVDMAMIVLEPLKVHRERTGLNRI
jgi:hypothetical protein